MTGGMPMSSGSYRRADIECLFYSSDDEKPHKQKILCESPVPGSNLSLFFRNKRDFETKIKLFCCQHFRENLERKIYVEY